MPGKKCAVSYCKNNYTDTKNSKSYHQFPNSEDLKKKWISFCCLKQKKNLAKQIHICSDHFVSDDFELNLQEQLLNIRTKRRLKPTAIPSVRVKSEECVISKRTERKNIKERKELVKTLIESSVEVVSESENLLINPNNDFEIKIKQQEQYIKTLEATIEEQKAIVTNSENVASKLREQLKSSEKKFSNFKINFIDRGHFIKEMKELLMPVLSSNQIDLILGRKKKIVWTKSELSNALTIRSFSKRCYIFLNKTLKYRLPGISTLQKYASKINLRHETPKDVHHSLNENRNLKRRRNEMKKVANKVKKILNIEEK